MIESLIMYLMLGCVAGIGAGLYGIGGGLLIVPVLVFMFSAQGMAESVLTHSAVATSLATIVVTSISSVRAHHRRGGVLWGTFKPLAVGIALGVLVGVWIADNLTGDRLQMIFGIFACLAAVQMAFDFRPKQGAPASPGNLELGGAGSVIGAISSLFGIGGGMMTVPYLSVRGIAMKQAVGTSAACGLPIALVGVLAYSWAGADATDMPEWSLGYIYLPAALAIVLTSSQFAKLGARWAHTLPQKRLKQGFALFLLIIGSRFLIQNLNGG